MAYCMFANIAQYNSKVVRLFARGAVCSEGQLLSLVRMYLTARENEVGLSGRGNSTGCTASWHATIWH